MRVLIVGCGYVGLPLGVELARQSHEVFGLRRSAAAEQELKTAGIHPLFADITKLDELKKLPRDFDWVVNCTASGGGSADDYRQIYLEGNCNLVSWLADSPPKKFIYTSSTSVYGQNDGSLVTEKSPVEPDTDMAKVLVEAEKLLLEAAGGSRGRSPPQKKFPAVILRVAGIYGPGRGHWLKQFLKNEARIEGDGARFLNMIHRDDVVGCIIAALENGLASEIYNAVDDEPVSQIDFFQWLAASLGKLPPPSVSEDVQTVRKRGATNKRASNHRLKTELGYQFKHPNFRIGYGAEILQLERAGELHATLDAQ
jgi:nucleoside-diphosphate-sugar epimerase